MSSKTTKQQEKYYVIYSEYSDEFLSGIVTSKDELKNELDSIDESVIDNGLIIYELKLTDFRVKRNYNIE